MTYNIVLGNYLPSNLEGLLVGVDFSAYNLLKNNYDLFLAIGDFDSISSEELEFVKQRCLNTICLKNTKDDTDLEAAIKCIKAADPSAFIIIHNFSFGVRMDHLYSIINLLRTYDVILKDEFNKIYLLKNNTKFYPNLKYLSFYAFDEVNHLFVSNLKYPIKNQTVLVDSHQFISNEALKNECFVSFDSGKLLIIESSE